MWICLLHLAIRAIVRWTCKVHIEKVFLFLTFKVHSIFVCCVWHCVLCLFYVVRLKSSFLTLHSKAEYNQMLRLCVLFVSGKHNDRRIFIETYFDLFMAHYFIVSTQCRSIDSCNCICFNRQKVVDTELKIGHTFSLNIYEAKRNRIVISIIQKRRFPEYKLNALHKYIESTKCWLFHLSTIWFVHAILIT